MNAFRDDDKYQRGKRDAILVPGFYNRYFWERYRLLNDDMDYQKRGIDTLIYTGVNAITHVEEKIVRKSYTAFALETKSCTIAGHEKPGWMFYGEADRLLYCFPVDDGLNCWWIDFPALQAWFWKREKDFASFQMETENKTAGRVVPIDAIDRTILVRNFHIKPMETPHA